MSIDKFDSTVYSEELFAVSEQEHDEVMRLMAEDGDGWQGYSEWSAALEPPAAENFVIERGTLRHKPEPPSRLRRGGYEL